MPDEQMPATSGSGNRMWYIIGGIVILLLLGWLVTRGLGGAMLAGSGVNVNSGPGGSTTYTDNQGNSVTVGGGTMPASWPPDAPGNYPGASISYSGDSNPQTGQAGAAVVYTTRAAAQSVVEYYKTQLAQDGWTISGTANTGGATVLSATKGTRTFGVYIVDSGNGSVSVTVGISS